MQNTTLKRIRKWFRTTQAIVRKTIFGYEIVVNGVIAGTGSTPEDAFADAIARHA